MIVYHEQVMRTLAALAGYALTYADHVRRNLERRTTAPGLPGPTSCRRRAARGVDPRRGRARPGTTSPSSPASASARPTPPPSPSPPTRSAYLKAHYPAHLIAGLLTHDPGMYPRRLILEDARHHDIPILPLDVNAANPNTSWKQRLPPRGSGPAEGGSPPSVVERSERSERRRAARRRARPSPGPHPHPNRPSGSGWRCRTSTASPMPRSARSCRRARSGRSGDVGDFMRQDHVSRPGERGDRRTRARSIALSRGSAAATQPVRGDDRGGGAGGRSADAHRRRHARARVQGLLRCRGRAGGAGGAGDGCLPAHRDASSSRCWRTWGSRARRTSSRAGAGTKVMVAGVKVASQTPAIRSRASGSSS